MTGEPTSFQPVILAVRAPWPYPPLPRGGVRIEAAYAGRHLTIIMGVDTTGIWLHQRAASLSGSFDCAIVGRQSYVLFALDIPPLFAAAPFNPARDGANGLAAYVSGLRAAASRRLVLVCVDNNTICRISSVAMTGSDWAVLADAVSA